MINQTHVYKGKPVEFIEFTYEWKGKQYCTVKMINKLRKVQRQTVQFCKLERANHAKCIECGSDMYQAEKDFYVCKNTGCPAFIETE